MKRNYEKGKWFIILLLCMLFSYPVFIQAENFSYQDTTKTDTSKIDTTKSDTLGYNNIYQTGINTYAINLRVNNLYLQDSIDTDTTKTDTTKSDTLGFNGINMHGSGVYAYNGNIEAGIYLSDSSETDTSKTDTTKKDTLGYINNSDNNKNYGVNENLTNNYKPALNKNDASSFTIFPVKDLAQKLKEDIYLKDEQTDQVKDILREYEARTYEAKNDNEGLRKAADEALKNIEDILTETQKKEWKNTKAEWWASVDKELNLSPQNNNDL